MIVKTWLSVVVMLLCPVTVTAQATEQFARRPACPLCRITIQPVAELAADDPAGLPLIPSKVTQDAKGRLLVTPTVTPGTVGIYSSRGVYIQSLGRYGEGPGEMREVHGIAAVAGDSIYVVHDLNSASVFTRELNFARRFRLESASFIARSIWSDQTHLFATRIGTGGGADYPLRLFSAEGEPGRGFGRATDFGEGRIYAAIAVAGDTIWAANIQTYEVDVFARSTGDLLRTLRRTTSWFPIETATGFISPAVEDIARAPNGQFWVLLRRPRASWSPPAARPSNAPVEAARRLSSSDLAEMFEYIVELVDLSGTPRVIKSASLGDRVADGFVDGQHLYGYVEDEASGAPRLVIWKLGVRQPD